MEDRRRIKFKLTDKATAYYDDVLLLRMHRWRYSRRSLYVYRYGCRGRREREVTVCHCGGSTWSRWAARELYVTKGVGMRNYSRNKYGEVSPIFDITTEHGYEPRLCAITGASAQVRRVRKARFRFLLGARKGRRKR